MLGWQSILRRLALAASWLITLRLASAVSQYATNIYLARILPAHETSDYWLCTTIVALAAYLAGFGYQAGAIRFLPAYLQQRDYAHARGYVQQLLWMTTLGPLCMAALALVAAGVWSSLIAPLPVGLMIASASLLLPTCLTLGLTEVIRATHRPVLSLVVPSLVLPVALLITVTVAAQLTELTAAALLYIGAAVYGIGAILQALIAQRLPEAAEFAPTQALFLTWDWLRRCLGLGTFGLTWNLSQTVDFLVVGARQSTEQVAIYGAVVKVLAAQHLLSSTLMVAAGSHIAAKLASRDTNIQHEVASLSALLAAAMLGSTALFLVFGDTLLGLFGAKFRQGYLVLCVLSAGLSFRALLGPCEALLTYGDREREVVVASLVTCLLTASGGWLLIDALGSLGVALAAVLAFAITWTTLYIRARRLMGFDPSVYASLRLISGR